MKTVFSHRFLALLSLIWLLTLAIVLTIYLAWIAYPLEINWLNILADVNLSKSDLLSNYNHLLSYLTNPFHQVLDMPYFPSSKDGLKHFSDVKGLFHLAQLILLVTSFPTICFFYKSWKERSLFIYQKLYVSAALLPVAIGILALGIGFNHFFTLFHQLLFPGDSTWLFNPYTDPVIMALPETFFLHCFLVFFVFYEVLTLTAYSLARKTYRLRRESLG